MKAITGRKAAEREPIDSQLTPAQRETWETIKAGFQALKDVDTGKGQSRPINELLRELDAPA